MVGYFFEFDTIIAYKQMHDTKTRAHSRAPSIKPPNRANAQSPGHPDVCSHEQPLFRHPGPNGLSAASRSPWITRRAPPAPAPHHRPAVNYVRLAVWPLPWKKDGTASCFNLLTWSERVSFWHLLKYSKSVPNKDKQSSHWCSWGPAIVCKYHSFSDPAVAMVKHIHVFSLQPRPMWVDFSLKCFCIELECVRTGYLIYRKASADPSLFKTVDGFSVI